jgi:uncharacterized membrane protein
LTLAPLYSATLAIQIHVIAAAAALVSGAAVVFLRKGTSIHLLLGRIAATGMGIAAISSYWIRHWGGFSWIHLLSILTLISITFGVFFRRRGDIANHKRWMMGAYAGLVGAGLFTILPGRVMNAVLFGG